jgi:hypothetical protein
MDFSTALVFMDGFYVDETLANVPKISYGNNY